MSRDLSLALVSGTSEYELPSTLESLNTNSLTIHLGGVNETKVYFQLYSFWQRELDRVTVPAGRPQYFTIAPDDSKLIFWPEPDEDYTVQYEGIKEVEEWDSTDVAGAGTSNALEPTGLRATYHDAILWQSVMSYAMHFEDGTKLSEAQTKFIPYKKYFEERFMPIPSVATDILYRNSLYVF